MAESDIRYTIEETQPKVYRWIKINDNGEKEYFYDDIIRVASTYNIPEFLASSRPPQLLPGKIDGVIFDSSCFCSNIDKNKFYCKPFSGKPSVQFFLYLKNSTNTTHYFTTEETGNDTSKESLFTAGVDVVSEPFPDFEQIYIYGYIKYLSESNGDIYTFLCSRLYFTFLSYEEKLSFSGEAIREYEGVNGEHPPYINSKMVWIRCDPKIKDITPESGSFFNRTESSEIKWNWDFLESALGNICSVTELSFLWGTTESTENSISLSPNDTSIQIPANTFPSKSTVYWRFKYKSDAYEGYLYTDVSTYTTTDGIPSVKILSPINVSIDGTIDNTFTWIYQIDTASKQKAFDLQYSANNGLSWEDVFTKEPSNNTFAVIPANTFNAGNNLWKVRAYNTDDVASEWSTPASIVVRAAPIKPTISSITKKPKITVGWQSTGQQAFQVLANDIDSGVVFGTGKTYTIPYYFRDGETVNIKVRIKNRFSEWSEWSEISVTVENTSTGNITALAQNVGNDVKLTWATETEFVCFYVLRGGIPIAKTTDLKEYTDYTSVGANEYQIMGITADGYYTLSNVVPVSVFPKTAVIGILSNTVSWVTLTYRRGNLPEIITSSSEEVYYQYYSGRKLPVAYSSRFKTKKKTLNFTVYKQDADAIENMIGQTVIYKDYAENKIIGIVNDVETSSNASRPDVRLEITAIDYQEDVGYD